MLKPSCSLLSSAVAVIACLAFSGCLSPIPDGQQVITSANIDEPVSTQTVNTVILDGQSNALRYGLAEAIRSELTERTGRPTEIITCAVSSTSLQFHLLGGSLYNNCAAKRTFILSNPNKRLVGAILIQGEANINDTPYIWSSLFHRYKDQRREDLIYPMLPIVYTQLPHTVDAERYTQEKVDLFKVNQQALLTSELYNDNVRMVVTEDLPLSDGVHFRISATPDLALLLVEQLYILMEIQEANGVAL